MDYSAKSAALILRMIAEDFKQQEPDARKVMRIWYTLVNSRSWSLARSLRPMIAGKIPSGPFKGMVLTDEMLAKSSAAILLGFYEHELHAVIEQIAKTPYDQIINIGCSLGYYAVGLALRLPHAAVHACDIDAALTQSCALLAELNGVAARMAFSGQFRGTDFTTYAGKKTLVVMDIEGGEETLLDPHATPALRAMDILVELHEGIKPGIGEKIAARFFATHNIVIIENRNILPDIAGILPPDFKPDAFDQLLLGWEARDGITPWAYMKAKA
jgi:hypothetical protein